MASLRLKVVLTGERHVGKSMFARAACAAVVDPAQAMAAPNTQPTLGTDVVQLAFSAGGVPVELVLWDTGGYPASRNDPSTVNVFRGCNAIVLVYDVTSRDSFNALPQRLAGMRPHAPDHATVTVLGTKIDLVPTAGRAVPRQEAAAYAASIDATFAEASCLAAHSQTVVAALDAIVGRAAAHAGRPGATRLPKPLPCRVASSSTCRLVSSAGRSSQPPAADHAGT